MTMNEKASHTSLARVQNGVFQCSPLVALQPRVLPRAPSNNHLLPLDTTGSSLGLVQLILRRIKCLC